MSAARGFHNIDMRSTLSYINRVASLVAAGLVFFMMLFITADVVGRAAASRPVPSATEFSALFLAAVVFLGLAYAEEEQAHIRVQILSMRLPPRARPFLDILAALAALSFFGLIAWEGMSIALDSLSIKEFYPSPMRLPMYPVRFVLVFGSILICLQLIVRIVLVWRQRPRGMPRKNQGS